MPVVGVVGTMVWDTIQRDDDAGSPFQEWGGIAYALAAADAVAPGDFRVRPIIRLGLDLAERAAPFIDQLAVIDSHSSVVTVAEPNPQVELMYRGEVRRCERLQGGVSPWSWSELQPHVRECDALYVNFITGDELDLEVARQLRRSFDGPIYADIHSLMLATGPRGERRPRSLDRWADWLSCFDVVQLNENELAAMSSQWGDRWAFAAQVVGREVGVLFVTLGAAGAVYFTTADALTFDAGRRPELKASAPVLTGKVAAPAVGGGDPTGCGDVWGITAFSALLAGCGVEEAVRRANAAASRNVLHRGATGLNRYLRGEIESGS